MVAVIGILAGAIIVLLTILIIKLERKRLRFSKVPGWPTVPILGNVHQLSRRSDEFTQQVYSMSKEFCHHGVFRLMLFDWYTLVLVSRAEEAEALISSSKHMDKSVDYRFLHPWLGTGLLTSTGDKWRSRRKMLTPSFHFRILNDFLSVFNDQAKILEKKLRAKTDGADFNIYTYIALCTLDIICETAMGRNVNAQGNSDSAYVKAVNRITELTILRQRSPWLWPDFIFNLTRDGKDYKKCLKILHEFTEKVIREKEEARSMDEKTLTMDDMLKDRDEDDIGKKKRLAFLDMLLCAVENGEKLPFLDVREEVDTFMFEGHDTTAVATNWAIHLIGANPEVQEKIHQELDGIFGNSDRPVTMDDLKEMKYLECALKEALRIFPSVPFFGRSLTEDTKIGNHKFEKGQTVIIVPAAIHMDKKVYPDPEKFDPDRFLPNNVISRHPYAFIPFSAGPRNCIGQKFAVMEEKVLLSTILRNFHVTSKQSKEELFPLAELILRPRDGIIVSLKPRK
ncbi:hypothetical protein ACJMK2_034175 [Sinanodonta woodiana]|uniref:Cytochrome P450 n=1 Tax=Sinanodonta woodiana TaxID=1069815 RepID=A0ABD3WUH7_SINWO